MTPTVTGPRPVTDPLSAGPPPVADPAVPMPVPVSTGAPGAGADRAIAGSTSIAEPVVAKLAALATREIDEVDSMGGTLSGALSGVVGRIRGDEHRTAGVGVEVGRTQAAVDLSVSVRYPASLPDVTGSIRETVVDRIESLTGLEVTEVNIVVTDLVYRAASGGDDSPRVQ